MLSACRMKESELWFVGLNLKSCVWSRFRISRLSFILCYFNDSVPLLFQLNIKVFSLKQNDLMRYFREDLHRRLLSTDFKKQVDGIEMLQRALPTTVKEIIEVLDILLKWFVLRFCESNTSCLLKVIFFGYHSLVLAVTHIICFWRLCNKLIIFVKHDYRCWNSYRSFLTH